MKKIALLLLVVFIGISIAVSGTISTAADQTEEKPIYTIQDVRNLQDFLLARLGKIDNITKEELKEILGDGDVTVTLSLSK